MISKINFYPYYLYYLDEAAELCVGHGSYIFSKSTSFHMGPLFQLFSCWAQELVSKTLLQSSILICNSFKSIHVNAKPYLIEIFAQNQNLI